jgi:hypothetical protein
MDIEPMLFFGILNSEEFLAKRWIIRELDV